jgi:hypothetical protein
VDGRAHQQACQGPAEHRAPAAGRAGGQLGQREGFHAHSVRRVGRVGAPSSTGPAVLWHAWRVDIAYDPDPDGEPDPGEVVWTWVPYEDDPAQGKDRPVLLIAREGSTLVALVMTSKDHDRDQQQENRAGRFWFDLGPGPWDPAGRPSEVRLNRFLVVDPADVRREGAVLDRARFDAVVAALRPHLPPEPAA